MAKIRFKFENDSYGYQRTGAAPLDFTYSRLKDAFIMYCFHKAGFEIVKIKQDFYSDYKFTYILRRRETTKKSDIELLLDVLKDPDGINGHLKVISLK